MLLKAARVIVDCKFPMAYTSAENFLSSIGALPSLFDAWASETHDSPTMILPNEELTTVDHTNQASQAFRLEFFFSVIDPVRTKIPYILSLMLV